jgi:hypothetical protein
MSKGEKVYPKIKLQHNHVIISANRLGQDSKIILADSTSNASLKINQTVLAKGVNVPEMINVGDMIYIDHDKIMAKAVSSGKSVHLRSIAYDKNTGEVLHDDNAKGIKEDDISNGLLITYNEILGVL